MTWNVQLSTERGLGLVTHKHGVLKGNKWKRVRAGGGGEW